MATTKIERTLEGETVNGVSVLGWMWEIDVPGVGQARNTAYHWSTPPKNAKVTRLVDAEALTALRFAEPAENFVNGPETLGNMVGDDGLEPPTSSV